MWPTAPTRTASFFDAHAPPTMQIFGTPTVVNTFFTEIAALDDDFVVKPDR